MHALLLATLALGFLQEGQPCDSCVVEPKLVELCAAHRRTESEVFAAQEAGLESEDAAVRISALERIADLTSEHSNAPSKRVASQLSNGLEDEDISVRSRAAQLLARGQNPNIAIPELQEAMRRVERDMKAEIKRVDKALKELERANKKFEKTENTFEMLESLSKATSNITYDTLIQLRALEREIVVSLASYPDERSAKTIEASARGVQVSDRKLAFADGLLGLGTQGTVTLAIRYLDTDEVGEVGEAAEWRFKLHQLLTEFASQHGLSSPDWSECGADPYRAWHDWFRGTRDQFPRKLGRFELGA